MEISNELGKEVGFHITIFKIEDHFCSTFPFPLRKFMILSHLLTDYGILGSFYKFYSKIPLENKCFQENFTQYTLVATPKRSTKLGGRRMGPWRLNRLGAWLTTERMPVKSHYGSFLVRKTMSTVIGICILGLHKSMSLWARRVSWMNSWHRTLFMACNNCWYKSRQNSVSLLCTYTGHTFHPLNLESLPIREQKNKIVM